jgi:ribosomal protein S18 acetylase RimI-like enzyme
MNKVSIVPYKHLRADYTLPQTKRVNAFIIPTMSSIPIPARANAHPNLRPLNVLRDLPQVADLIELCFRQTMDRDGENYVREMRRAGREKSWMRSMENASNMPLNGYVWEQDGKIVGNASLIVFRHNRRKIHLIANVAVHPDHRHHGIARAVTAQVMERARTGGTQELWLNVRDDNPDALDLYSDLGFRERARRTQWLVTESDIPSTASNKFQIVPRPAHFWPAQRAWLEQLHPEELAWYRGWNFKGLAPGLWNWLYLLFVDMNLRQWAALHNDKLQAVRTRLCSRSRDQPPRPRAPRTWQTEIHPRAPGRPGGRVHPRRGFHPATDIDLDAQCGRNKMTKLA